MTQDLYVDPGGLDPAVQRLTDAASGSERIAGALVASLGTLGRYFPAPGEDSDDEVTNAIRRQWGDGVKAAQGLLSGYGGSLGQYATGLRSTIDTFVSANEKNTEIAPGPGRLP